MKSPAALHPQRLLFLGALMDLCWLTALGHFLVVATTPLGFPLKTLGAAYAGAVLLTAMFRTGRPRLIWPLLAHLAGLCLAGALILSSAGIPVRPQGIVQWYHACLLGTMTAIFWYKGRRLAGLRWTYFSACNHFDTGVAFLFGLLCVKLTIHLKSEVQIPDTLTFNAILLYFLTGAGALFTAGSPSGARREFSGDFRLLGTLLTSAVLILVVGAGLVLLFNPVMTSFAGTGYSLLKEGLSPLGPIFMAILRFLFAPRSARNAGAVASGGQGGSDLHLMPHGSGTGWWEAALVYGLTGLLCAALVLGGIWLIIVIVRYLLFRRLPESGEPPVFLSFFSFLRLLAAGVAGLKNRLFKIFMGTHTAGQAYEGLVSWGRHSGVTPRIGETPGEYANRLCQRFSPVQPQIRTILKAFELEVYAGRQIRPAVIREARAALKRLRSPSLWWMRLKSRVTLEGT